MGQNVHIIFGQLLRNYLKRYEGDTQTEVGIGETIGRETEAQIGELAQYLLTNLARELKCDSNCFDVLSHLTQPEDWRNVPDLEKCFDDANDLLIREIKRTTGYAEAQKASDILRKEAHDLAQTLMSELLAKVLPKQLRVEDVAASCLLHCPELTKPMIAAVLQNVQKGLVAYSIKNVHKDKIIDLQNIYSISVPSPEGTNFSENIALWDLYCYFFPDKAPTSEQQSQKFPDDLLKKLRYHLQHFISGKQSPDTNIVWGLYLRENSAQSKAFTQNIHEKLSKIPLVVMNPETTTVDYLLLPEDIDLRYMNFLVAADKLLSGESEASKSSPQPPSPQSEGDQTMSGNANTNYNIYGDVGSIHNSNQVTNNASSTELQKALIELCAALAPDKLPPSMSEKARTELAGYAEEMKRPAEVGSDRFKQICQRIKEVASLMSGAEQIGTLASKALEIWSKFRSKPNEEE